MKPVGLLIAFAGYTFAYFGWCSLRGPGVGLVDLLVPGRAVLIPGGAAKAAQLDPAGFANLTAPQRAALWSQLDGAQRKLLLQQVPGFVPPAGG